MSIALKDQDGNLFWFDAVLNLGDSYTGTVSSHPIETGATITDHTVVHNNGIQFAGVISDVDFNTRRPILINKDLAQYKLDNVSFVDNSTPTNQVKINSNTPNPLTAFIPDSISQFINTNQLPSVILPSSAREITLEQIKDKLITLQQGAVDPITKIPSGTSLVAILLFNGNQITRVYSTCIITHLSFSETPENDGCLYANLSLEQVRFVKLEKSQVGSLSWKTISTKADKTKNKGVIGAGKPGTDNGTTDPANADPTSTFSACVAGGGTVLLCTTQYLGAKT